MDDLEFHPYFRLEGTRPVPECDSLVWDQWFKTADRTVARTPVAPDIDVSTVFLGLNHQWGAGPPLLFETMVFQGDTSWDWQERYTTWDEAVAGHAAMVLRVEAHLAGGSA